MGTIGGGVKCVKYVVFTFNILFWLAGLTVVGIGLWMYFDPGRYDSFLGKYKFTIPAAIFIASGLFVCIVGFCGCWGAINESKCMLGTFFTMILLIFCAEIAAGILGFLYRDKVQDAITRESQDIIRNKYGTGDSDIDYSTNLVQEKLKCCGAFDKSDYQNSRWQLSQPQAKVVPQSCCATQAKCAVTTDLTEVYPSGCISKAVNYVKDHMLIIGGIGIGCACLQLLGMLFACILFFSIDQY